ncbi:MAG: c-type cytochrome [Acidobacteria bacterium]|nr:c-type cytochrome [Acidobacteriota bacterium]
MRLSLAIASLAILVVHGFVFYQQFFHKWENYQTSYFDQARTLAKTDAEREALAARKPKIEQIIVTQFGNTRVDRCTTCHIGSDDPRFKDAPHPYKAHPYSEALGDKEVGGKWERRHKFSDIGCTVCHDGQGRGLQEFYAHGEDEFWTEPMLGYVAQENWKPEYKEKLKGKEFMEANCAQCHTEKNFKSTPTVNKGRELFLTKNCYGCHRIEGISNGTLGPDLTDVGKKWNLNYLHESVVDPRANSATSFMPRFNVTDDEVKALVVFLKSRRGFNYAETTLDRYRATLNKSQPAQQSSPAPNGTATTTQIAADSLKFGEQLVNEKACAACHKIGDKDGAIAPDLSFEGLLKDDKWIVAHFKDPRALVPDSIMPTFGFTDPEFQAMSAYLVSLNKPPPIGNAQETYQNLCMRCHGDKGDGHGMIATYLDPYPRDFTNVGFMNSKPEDRLVSSIKNGVGGTSMPAWGKVLNDEQIKGVLAYINENFTKEKRSEIKARNVPDQNPVPMSAESVARGEGIYVQRCTGCHGRKADGKGANSLDILPRPRNLLNFTFVNQSTDRRLFESIMYGVQGTAMPPWIDYGLTNNDVGDLVNYIRSLNQGKKDAGAMSLLVKGH